MSQRFIVNNTSLNNIRDLATDIDAIDLIKNKSILIISNVVWYNDNEAEIKQWCDASLTKWSQKGMILGFINDEERNLFLMRWA